MRGNRLPLLDKQERMFYYKDQKLNIKTQKPTVAAVAFGSMFWRSGGHSYAIAIKMIPNLDSSVKCIKGLNLEAFYQIISIKNWRFAYSRSF
jgi:hypothetical protein